MNVRATFRYPALARPAPLRVLAAGLAASAAYLAAQTIDRRVTGNRYDDLILWGGFMAREPLRQRLLGLLVHCGVGLSLAAAYLTIRPSLPRLPAPLQAVLFVQAENTLLFPTVKSMDAVHPAVRRGQLPRLWTWQYLWIEAWRHLAYGLVLGLLAGKPVDEREI